MYLVYQHCTHRIKITFTAHEMEVDKLFDKPWVYKDTFVRNMGFELEVISLKLCFENIGAV